MDLFCWLVCDGLVFLCSFCYKEYNTLASFGIYMTSALLCVLDNSVFSWGLGVGLMYMMSTGKAEIGRLNTAMDETAKDVQELKTELHKRKSSRGLQFSSSTNTSAKLDIIGGRNTNPVSDSSTEHGDNVHDSGFLLTEEGGSASSVLTDEPRQELVEMDRLEAELESELQKLPWCSREASGADGRISDICEVSYCSLCFSQCI